MINDDDIEITCTHCDVTYTHKPTGMFQTCLFNTPGVQCLSLLQQRTMTHNLEESVACYMRLTEGVFVDSSKKSKDD